MPALLPMGMEEGSPVAPFARSGRHAVYSLLANRPPSQARGSAARARRGGTTGDPFPRRGGSGYDGVPVPGASNTPQCSMQLCDGARHPAGGGAYDRRRPIWCRGRMRARELRHTLAWKESWTTMRSRPARPSGPRHRPPPAILRLLLASCVLLACLRTSSGAIHAQRSRGYDPSTLFVAYYAAPQTLDPPPLTMAPALRCCAASTTAW